MIIRSVSVTGGSLPTAQNIVLEFGHWSQGKLQSMSFPQQEILFFKNCNIWVNLRGGSQSPELLVRDSWSLVVSKCHLKCKCSSQAGLASFQNCGGKQLRKGFLAGMGLLKILTAIPLVVCWSHWTCYLKSGLGSAKHEEPLNVLAAWGLTSVSEECAAQESEPSVFICKREPPAYAAVLSCAWICDRASWSSWCFLLEGGHAQHFCNDTSARTDPAGKHLPTYPKTCGVRYEERSFRPLLYTLKFSAVQSAALIYYS